MFSLREAWWLRGNRKDQPVQAGGRWTMRGTAAPEGGVSSQVERTLNVPSAC
jgi:hypothetical protein